MHFLQFPDLYRGRKNGILMSLMPAIFCCEPWGIRTHQQYVWSVSIIMCGVICLPGLASVLPLVINFNAVLCNSPGINYSIKWQARQGPLRELKFKSTSHSM